MLVLDDEDAEYFKYYIDVVRSTIKGGQHTSELALLTYNGRPLFHYRDLKSPAKKEWKSLVGTCATPPQHQSVITTTELKTKQQ